MKTLKLLPGEFLFDFSQMAEAWMLSDSATTLCHHTNGCGGVKQHADIADFF